MKTFAKVLAVLAILGLVLSSFAIGVGAQVTTDVSHASPMASFNRNLTIGSMGADVTALQMWLIARGFTIPAGATGYFGGQTQAALARLQASVGINPAAGYFGPITRGHVLATIQNPSPEPDEDEDKDEDEDEDDQESDLNDAKEAIEDTKEALDDARDEVDEAEDDGDDIDDADDLLDEAEDMIDDARDALSDKDYDEAIDLADEAEDLIDEALDEINASEDEDEDDDNDVSTSARVSRVDGADNDYAVFEIELDLAPFNQDAYIDEDADVSFEYEVQDSEGNEVTGADSMTAYIKSSAEEEDGYYQVEEDETESFTLIVIFNPLAADEGQLYRLQLLGINYADDEEAPTDTMTTRPESEYRTKSVIISD